MSGFATGNAEVEVVVGAATGEPNVGKASGETAEAMPLIAGAGKNRRKQRYSRTLILLNDYNTWRGQMLLLLLLLQLVLLL